MLDVRVKIDGVKAVAVGLGHFIDRAPLAAQRGLKRIVRGLHREAYDFLSGAAGKPGSYPTPVISGHLRRNLDWLEPGEKKTVGGATFAAGELEVMLFDSAIYASVVHDGTGSSSSHGPRQFTDDALEAFDAGGRIEAIMEDEFSTESKRIGK